MLQRATTATTTPTAASTSPPIATPSPILLDTLCPETAPKLNYMLRTSSCRAGGERFTSTAALTGTFDLSDATVALTA